MLQFLANEGLLDNGLKVRVMTMPDRFLEQDKPETQYEQAAMKATHMVASVLAALGRADEADPAVLGQLA